jgi:hypothetical protein
MWPLAANTHTIAFADIDADRYGDTGGTVKPAAFAQRNPPGAHALDSQ